MSKRSEERSAAYRAWRAATEAEAKAARAALAALDRASYEAGYAQSELTIKALRWALIDLDHENARLIAKLRGYMLAGSAKGPGVLVHNGLATARGVNRETYKPRHRYPFVLASDGTWKRAKGRLRLEDWAMRLPPKVCEMCGHLFVTGRRDAKTCSPACRVNLHRKHKHR
jgi:hypothetical protein